jgi:TonB family protein
MRRINSCCFALALLSASAAAGAEELKACDPEPKLLHSDSTYKESRIPHTGMVVLRITVDTTGAVSQPTIISSTDSWLDDWAQDSARLWRYSPTEHTCTLKITLRYAL